MKTILLDANIILDFLLEREPSYEKAQKIFKMVFEEKVKAYLSATTLYNIARTSKNGGQTKLFLKNLLSFVKVAEVNKSSIWEALNSQVNSFENALQDSLAQENQLDFIITRDLEDYANSQTRVLSPDEFLARFF